MTLRQTLDWNDHYEVDGNTELTFIVLFSSLLLTLTLLYREELTIDETLVSLCKGD